METINTIQRFLSSGLAFVMYIAIPAFILYKVIRKKKFPNNRYTPVDEILAGKNTEINGDEQGQDKRY